MDHVPGARGRTLVLATALVSFIVLCLLPPSGQGPTAIELWQDQGYFVSAVTMAGETGRVDDDALRALVGPGYVALGVLTKRLTGVDYATAIIILARLSLLAGAVCALLYAVRTTDGKVPRTTVAGVLLSVSAIVFSTWPYASDIPWTHFTAAAVLAALVAISDPAVRFERTRLVVAGALFALLWQVRSFEGMVFAIAAAIAMALTLLMRRWEWREWFAALPLRAALFVLGCVLSLVAIGMLSGSWLPFAQYSHESSAQTAILLSLLPDRLVQLFIDPCYKTLCALVGYKTAPWPPTDFDYWALPLFAEMPAVVASLVGLAMIFALAPRAVARVPFSVLLAAGTAVGLIVGYASAMPSGSPHLKYGFFRDFLAPMLLLTMAFVGWTRSVDGLMTGRGGAVKVGAAYLVVFALIAAGWTAQFTGLPRVGPTVTEFRVVSDCDTVACRLGLEGYNEAGQLPYDDRSYVLLACADGPRELFGPVSTLTAPRDCTSAAVLPALSGVTMTPERFRFLDNPVPLRDGQSSVTVR